MPDIEKFSVSVHFFCKKMDRTENFFAISPNTPSDRLILPEKEALNGLIISKITRQSIFR